MRTSALLFGNSFQRLYSCLVVTTLRMRGVRIGRRVRFLGALKLSLLSGAQNLVIEDDVSFMGSVDIRTRDRGRIIIGVGAKIDEGVRLIAANDATLSIGEKSKIMFYANINAGVDITLGNKTGISAYCLITSSQHYTDRGTPYMEQGYEHSPIQIGNDVQIGSHCVIFPGVTVGDGAIISTHSVVSTNVKNNTVVAGIPARAVRQR